MKVRTACNRDCPDACSMIATVENDRVVRLEGDPDHPVTRGFLCYRTNRFLDRQYDPRRLTRPQVRRSRGLVPVSWDDALDLIAEKMLRIKTESGPAAIFHYRSGGSLGLMKHVVDHFFERFGPVSVKSGDICSGAGEAAQETDFGIAESNDLFDLLNSRTIILWGKNPYVSNVHLQPVLKEARAKGARLIQIDPVRHRGGDLCELYVQPRPGGDAALALGLGRRMFELDAADPSAAEYCDHFDSYRELVFSREVDDWCAIAGVSRADFDRIATLYADGPAAIQVGWGMQRRANGATIVRALDALGAISGNLGVPGGGVSFYFGRRTAFDTSFSAGKSIAPRTIPEPLLGPGLLEASDPAVRMVWVTAGNPVAMLPESHTVARALQTRELTVVVDAFPTDTTECADVVLPTTTMLEEDDLLGAYGNHWLSDVQPVVAPPGEAMSDYAIVCALATRLGHDDAFHEPPSAWKQRMMSKLNAKGVTLDQLREGAVRNPLAAEVLFADRRFPTPSGKVNLLTDAEVEPSPVSTERPLLLMPLAARKSQSSQWPPSLQEGPAPATLHPDSAQGFADGDEATLESAVGSMQVRLRFDAAQRRDVVLLDKGGWLGRGRCANALIEAAETDAGGGARYYETPVRLMRSDA
ncbi:molybdopterin-containing oxidoreductase catalytic subunit [Acidobacteria bacterium Mor1]|nr:molybdopterin-containing oxidoreductase catalytic subunit [Acidobacteria bacterium Mor1]